MALFGVFLGLQGLARTLQRSCKDIAKGAGNAVIAGLAGVFEVCKMIARWDIFSSGDGCWEGKKVVFIFEHDGTF